MSDKTINIGIIGLGEHTARAHVKHLVNMPGVRLTSWFDPSTKKIDTSCFEALQEQPERTSFIDMLNDQEVHAVVIGSPDEFHASQLLRSVQFGKHVFCEKPMIVGKDQEIMLREAFDQARENKLVISTCHPRRFDPPYISLRAVLQRPAWVEKNLGRIYSFHFDFWYHEVTDEWKKDRSLLLDHWGHEIDLLRFLFGSDRPWIAKTKYEGFDKYSVEGHCYLQTGNFADLPFDFQFTGHRSLAESVYQETITIKGSKGGLVLNANSGELMVMQSGVREKMPGIDYDCRFGAVNADFVNAIRAGTVPYLTEDDMLVNNVSGIGLSSKMGCYNFNIPPGQD